MNLKNDVYIIDMSMSIKSTNLESLRSELVELKGRIDAKLKKLYYVKKLPYERLAKGRSLATLVDIAIKHLDKYELNELEVCLKDLVKKGVKLKN
jgi:hypothetical protein